MSLLSEQIMMRLAEIRQMTKDLEKKLSKAPEGRLRISTSKGFTRYYQVQPDSGANGRYLPRKEEELAKQLAQKDYDGKVLAMLEQEKKVLEKAAAFYLNAAEEPFFAGPEELVWSGLVKPRKEKVSPVSPDTETYITQWMAEEYKRKEFRDNDKEYIRGSGIRVRSKTELIIAEMLEKKKIPYHYEKPLLLSGQGIVHPDFTVLNVRKRKTLYYEHMGMMDDAEYRDHALERINQYIRSGYYPGNQLVLTHETAARPIRTGILEKVIEEYFE